MDIPNLRWWGWGTLDQDFSLEGRPAFWPTLREWLELPDEAIEHETSPVPLEEISLRPPCFDDPMLSSLRKLVGEGMVHTDRRGRVEHAYGKSYRDLIRIRAGHIPNPPDAVVYPADPGQVVSLLAWAADRDVAVVPFGGGSSVLGGVEPAPGDRPTVTLDLAQVDRVLAVDPVSRCGPTDGPTFGLGRGGDRAPGGGLYCTGGSHSQLAGGMNLASGGSVGIIASPSL